MTIDLHNSFFILKKIVIYCLSFIICVISVD